MDYSIMIKKLRNILILSQGEFAELLGVSFSTVNRWENGKYEPTIKIQRKLHKMFVENNIGENGE